MYPRKLFQKNLSRLVCGVIGGLLLSSSTAYAQSVDEIIVTAQKRSQSLQDVPFTVSANTGERLEELRVYDLTDLQTIVPGLQSPSTGSPGEGASFRLRGFGSPPFQLGIEPAVATFVDGIYRSRSGIAVNDLLDIDRIEVLKGPQGTLFGKNTTAGVVHVITQKPVYGENSGSAEFVAENDSRYRLKAIANIGTSDTSAFRLAASYGHGDGWLKNDGPLDDLHDLNRYTLRGQYKADLSDSLTMNLSFDFSKIDENCCATVRYQNGILTEDLPTPFGTFSGLNTLARANNQPTLSPDNFANYRAATNDEESNQADDMGFGVELTYNMNNGMQLVSITSLRDYDLSTLVDGDFSGADVLVIDTDVQIESITQELRLSGTFGAESNPSNWMIGAYYTDEQIDRLRTFIWQSQVSQFYPIFPVVPGVGVIDDLTQDSESMALFANVEFAVSDRLSLSAGVRYNEEEKDGSGVLTQPNNGPLGVMNGTFNAKIDEDETTWSASAKFDVTDTVMAYVSAAKGYKAGGINLAREAAGRAGAAGNPTFDPEEVDHEEIGFKSTLLDNQVRLNVAYFSDEYTDIQNQILVGQDFIVLNGRGADIDGIEAEVQVAVSEYFDVFVGYQDIETEFHTGSVLGFNNDVSGKSLPWAPERSLSIGWSYRRPTSSGFEWFHSGNWLSRSEYQTGASADQPMQDDTDILNAQMGIAHNGWEASLWCRNCTDEEYAEIIFNSPVDFFPGLPAAKEAFVGRPRELGISVRRSF